MRALAAVFTLIPVCNHSLTHVIAPMLQSLFQMLFLAAMHANASFALHLLSYAIICYKCY